MRYASRLLLAAMICGPTSAIAQVPKDVVKDSKSVALPPVASSPERTTASFGDWVMRCEGVGMPAKQVCEAAQIVTVQGQTNPMAQVAIGRPGPTGGKQMTVVLPPNVAFATKPQVAAVKAASIDMVWQRCAPGACFASAPIADSALTALSAEAEPGRILFKDSTDRDVTLPLSFRGLSQALAALAKEP